MATISFWERETFLKNTDLAIVGSGIVGLSAAIEFKTRFPDKKVLVLERGPLPFGASSKNAGFACFGSITELLDDISRMGENAVFSLVEKRCRGLQELRRLVGREEIDYQNHGGYELFTSGDEEVYEEAKDQLQYLNSELKPIIGADTFSHADEKIVEFGFKQTNHLIFNQYEAQINTGKMISRLWQKATDLGVRVLNGVTVHEISDNNRIELATSMGTLYSDKCLVATNGLTRLLLPNLEVKPARAQVLITNPIQGLPFKGTFHYEQGYYYFRNVDNRVLFGGGRNLDFAGEETAQIEISEHIQNELERLLREVILPDLNFTVDQRWAGIMGVSNSKSTISRHLSENLYCAVRLGGMGVAIGSLIGKDAITELYA